MVIAREHNERAFRRRPTWQVSKIQSLEFMRMAPDLFQAITQELPWQFVHWWDNGITFSDAVWKRIIRNGPKGIQMWLEENKVKLSEKGQMIVQALKHFHAFTTFDKLLEYLRYHNWGELRVDATAEEQLHIQRVKDLAIQKAVAEKRSRLEKLTASCKERLAKPNAPNKEMLLNIISNEAIEKFGVTKGTAKQYAQTVVYNALVSTKIVPLSKAEIKLVEKQDSWNREYRALLKNRDSLKDAIRALVSAKAQFPDRFDWQRQIDEKEIELGAVESEIREFYVQIHDEKGDV